MTKFKIITLCLTLGVLLTSCKAIKIPWLQVQAETAYNQGNFEQAVKLYEQLIELKPDSDMYHWHLGICYFSQGKTYKAQKEVVQLRKIGAEDLAKDLEQLIAREKH